MNLLKRSKKIDFTSKDFALHGHVKIELRDPDTHKVKDVIEKTNMMTNALKSLYKSDPYSLGSQLVDGAAFVPSAIQPMYSKALAGCITFPEVLGNDPDLLYPSFAGNYPVGYASNEAYTLDDSRQGYYDVRSSDFITNGYRHVFVWGSSYGNGTIKSVALSNSKAYKYFNDMSLVNVLPAGTKNLAQATGNGAAQIVGCNSKGIYFNNGEDSFGAFPPNAKLRVWEKSRGIIDLMFDASKSGADASGQMSEVFEYPFYGYFFIDEDYAYFAQVTSAAENNSTVDFYTIDLSDNSSSKVTFTVASYLKNYLYHSGDTMAKRGDYIYLFHNSGEKVVKINVTNSADFDEIDLPSGLTNPMGFGLTLVKGVIYGNGFIIGDDDLARAATPIAAGNARRIFDCGGVWGVYGSTGVGAAVIAPYCATHADLPEPVVKNASREMIIVYEITQV